MHEIFKRGRKDVWKMFLGNVYIIVFYGRPEKVSLTKNIREQHPWFNALY